MANANSKLHGVQQGVQQGAAGGAAAGAGMLLQDVILTHIHTYTYVSDDATAAKCLHVCCV